MCFQEYSQKARLKVRHSNDSIGSFSLKLIKIKTREERSVSPEEKDLATHYEERKY